jgi:hypothetical protein
MDERSSQHRPEFDISRTDFVSANPSITTDVLGGLHIVWTELETSGTTDIHSTFWDGQTYLTVNVSASETFGSTRPHVIADSLGMAHIVWEEKDDDYSAVEK